MLLGEPPPTPYDIRMILFGFPVRIHPFFWITAVLLGLRSQDAQILLAWITAMFLGILLHEFGHALAMRYYGLDPWITLYGLGGLTSARSASAYRGLDSSTFAQIFISFAGPLAGFAGAGLITVAAVAAGNELAWSPLGPRIVWNGLSVGAYFGDFLFQICVFWGLINLLPVYPLDGGQIAREVFQYFSPRGGIRNSLLLSMVTAGGLAALAVLLFRSLFMALMFGYLSYMSYRALEAYEGHRRG